MSINEVDYSQIFIDFPDCISIKDLQKMLRIGRNSAYKLLKTQAIKNKKMGRIYLIPKISVINYLLNGCTKT